MLAIRLRRTGSTKRPYYRVVGDGFALLARRAFRRGARALRSAARARGREIDAERAQYWIKKGAKPSDTVRSLLKRKPEA
jgi:small subunit ribosomal protein S16